MKKLDKKKLTLTTQTLRQLSTPALTNVAGGLVVTKYCKSAGCLPSELCPTTTITLF
jgi:hypothetical protein